MGTDTCLREFKCRVKVVTAVAFKRSKLLNGRCYEAEIGIILLLLSYPFRWYPSLQTFFGLLKIKPWTIVHGLGPENENFDFGKKMISSERASQEEQNGANFSFIAPSSDELWVPILPEFKCMVKVVTVVAFKRS